MAGDIDAGEFSTWLELTRKGAGQSAGADVPCGDCAACCTSSYFIHVQPHETAALARIPDELLFPAPGLPDGHRVLGHDEHGCCPMLVDGGCSIYDDRPQTCRDYDCRLFAATGIELVDDDKAMIAAQIKRWSFGASTASSRAQREAVRASADFLRSHRGHLTAGAVPNDPTHLAMVAIEIHDVFLTADAGTLRCVAPDIDVVDDALRAMIASTLGA